MINHSISCKRIRSWCTVAERIVTLVHLVIWRRHYTHSDMLFASKYSDFMETGHRELMMSEIKLHSNDISMNTSSEIHFKGIRCRNFNPTKHNSGFSPVWMQNFHTASIITSLPWIGFHKCLQYDGEDPSGSAKWVFASNFTSDTSLPCIVVCNCCWFTVFGSVLCIDTRRQQRIQTTDTDSSSTSSCIQLLPSLNLFSIQLMHYVNSLHQPLRRRLCWDHFVTMTLMQ